MLSIRNMSCKFKRCAVFFYVLDYMSNNKTNFTYLYLPSALFIVQRYVGPSKQLTQVIQIEHKNTLLRIPTRRRQMSCLFTSVVEDLNSRLPTVKQILVVFRVETEPGSAGLQIRRANHSATLAPILNAC